MSLYTSLCSCLGAIGHLILMTILYLWQPSSSDRVFIFLVAGGLGVVDATWQTEICSKHAQEYVPYSYKLTVSFTCHLVAKSIKMRTLYL